ARSRRFLWPAHQQSAGAAGPLGGKALPIPRFAAARETGLLETCCDNLAHRRSASPAAETHASPADWGPALLPKPSPQSAWPRRATATDWTPRPACAAPRHPVRGPRAPAAGLLAASWLGKFAGPWSSLGERGGSAP